VAATSTPAEEHVSEKEEKRPMKAKNKYIRNREKKK
jgi:hypothetical protein